MCFFLPSVRIGLLPIKKTILYKHIFIKQLKQIQNSNTRFRSLSGDMMTGFVQAAVVGAGVEGRSAP